MNFWIVNRPKYKNASIRNGQEAAKRPFDLIWKTKSVVDVFFQNGRSFLYIGQKKSRSIRNGSLSVFNFFEPFKFKSDWEFSCVPHEGLPQISEAVKTGNNVDCRFGTNKEICPTRRHWIIADLRSTSERMVSLFCSRRKRLTSFCYQERMPIQQTALQSL